jgi:hypothetical protein
LASIPRPSFFFFERFRGVNISVCSAVGRMMIASCGISAGARRLLEYVLVGYFDKLKTWRMAAKLNQAPLLWYNEFANASLNSL